MKKHNSGTLVMVIYLRYLKLLGITVGLGKLDGLEFWSLSTNDIFLKDQMWTHLE